jgi:hypothetical protein
MWVVLRNACDQRTHRQKHVSFSGLLLNALLKHLPQHAPVILAFVVGISGAAAASTAAAAEKSSRQQPAIALDQDDIGGVVSSASGPEAGVWVIAETTEFATRYAKIVVTDDEGRYVVPDLPKASFGCAATDLLIPQACRARPATS